MGAPEQKLILRMFPAVNGGWIVEEELPDQEGCYQVLAAVSSAADLVKWLAGHLDVDLNALDVRVELTPPPINFSGPRGAVDPFDDQIQWARDINTCKACRGRGVSPKGRECQICHGTGQRGGGGAPPSTDEKSEGGDA